MAKDQSGTFTDRREAIALFEHLRGRDPNKPWSLLPILTFIAPGGSGKSTLIKYLRDEKCSLSYGKAVVPYAHLDFTQLNAPKDLLAILISLRDQFQRHDDGQGRHLTFPRFDLGSLIAQATTMNEDLSSFTPSEVRRKLTSGKRAIESLSALGGTLGYTVPFIPPLLAGLNLAGQIKPLKDLLIHLEEGTGWKWYRTRWTETGLGPNATLEDVLRRLHILSMPGKPERETLVNDLLPAAFIADLFDSLIDSDPPRCWSKTANIVFFLDGFETLQSTSSSTATQLLRILTTKQRKSGKTDPILLVVASRIYLPGTINEVQSISFERSVGQDEHILQQQIQKQYQQWQQRLPSNHHFLRLKDLYLTLQLKDFSRDDTRDYLLQFGEQMHSQIFVDDDALVQKIDQVTQGHPLYLALAAQTVLEAKARGQSLNTINFEGADVSSEIAPEYEDKRVADYLLDLFLRQMSEFERKDLFFCAVPRFLDVSLLRVVLPSLDEIDAQNRWSYYCKLTFVSAIDEHRIVFHPLVRTLLLQQLPPNHDPKSIYFQTHTLLLEYFRKLAGVRISSPLQEMERWKAHIEEAYHALALGNPELAIRYGIAALQSTPSMWEPLLEAVMQAPTKLMPPTINKQSNMVQVYAETHHSLQDWVRAIILQSWLLASLDGSTQEFAVLQLDLGNAYYNLPGGDRQANIEKAIAYYQAALQIFTREAFPTEWAGVMNDLGNAYRDLIREDRQANVKKAIACFEAALEIRTRDTRPFDWARTLNNLGTAYAVLEGDKQAHIEKAIACYQAVLQIYTQEAFPTEWANLQNNLGAAYAELPDGDQELNRKKAVEYLEATLLIYTRETFPFEWAREQNSLGTLYRKLLEGSQQTNIERAIACFEAALQVYTREELPLEWAEAQTNLGKAYRDLPEGGQQANIEKAIACFEATLLVYTREVSPLRWARVQQRLGTAYALLSTLSTEIQQELVEKTIVCFEAALQVFTREDSPTRWAMIKKLLGVNYLAMTWADQQIVVKKAVENFEAALQVYTCEGFPAEWAETQYHLGRMYSAIRADEEQMIFEEQGIIQKVILCFEAALQIYRRETFPIEWAEMHSSLGVAYWELSEGDRYTNLKKAITYLEAALQVYTHKAFPSEWAMTKNNLGSAYRDLPGGDRRDQLKKAIACFHAALRVHTREAFSRDWARAKQNLALAYLAMEWGDRATNVRKAIACLEAALQVYTRDAFPINWSVALHNLGYAYLVLGRKKKHAHLKEAISCFETALQIRTRENFPMGWAMTQLDLGIAYWSLADKQSTPLLKKAIECFVEVQQFSFSNGIDYYARLATEYLERTREELQKLEKGS